MLSISHPFNSIYYKSYYFKIVKLFKVLLSIRNIEFLDDFFEQFFPLLKQYSTDERNFVKKAVNWAVRQIGKRNLRLNKKAIVLAQEIHKIPSSSAKWIATDALRELTNKKTIALINRPKR